jgi:hypothetical protein
VRARPLVVGIIAILVGCLVLIGWSFDVESLKRVLPSFVAMNPGTATLFIFCGTALILRTERSESRAAVLVARVLAGIARAPKRRTVKKGPASAWQSFAKSF